ncbi:MAG: sulfotransferase [Thiohalocapsa sp.]|nr:sulfotransferase [Thiohalocapsa sp.]MCF7989622.1 sulfotransferase [Thiohalocapsa sp.]
MEPNFLIIGAPKAATTWIADALREHPDVFVPQLKELRYYCGQNFDKGRSWYAQQFEGAAGEPVVGEASPSYLGSVDATARIRADLPDVKLIASLRHPVEQAFSFYWHQLSRGLIDVDTEFRAFFEQDRPRASYYGRHLQRYMDTFPKDQMLVLLYEQDIEGDPGQGIRKCYDFLGVDPSFQPTVISKRSNSKRDVTAFHGAAAATRRVLRALPRDMTRPVKQAGKKLLGMLPKKQTNATLDRGLRQELLLKYYRDDIRQLESASGMDFSVWYER